MTGTIGEAKGIVPPRLHLRHVEGLRAAAALVVYVNHAYAQSWNPIQRQFPDGALSAFTYSLVAGHLAVSVFIVISGFCLTLPVVDAGDELAGGARPFLKRRARRILPPYYGALALSLVLIATVIGQPTGTLWDVPIEVHWYSIVSHILLLQDVLQTGKINYVFWSIAVEWQIYFLFPLLVASVKRFGIGRTVGGALALGYALRFGFDGSRLDRANPHYLGLFALGMLAAYVVRSPRPELARARVLLASPWLAAGALGAVCALSLYWGWEESTRLFHLLDLPTGVMAAGILVTTSLAGTSPLARVLSARPLVFIGTFSYSVYLVHAPLLQLLWQYVLVPWQHAPLVLFPLLMTLGAAIVLGGAYGFFRVCEEPFMRPRVRAPLPAESAAAAPAA